MADNAKWYVAHTYSGYENKVATDLMTMVENRHLQDLICDVKVPTETRIEEVFDKRGNKTGEKEVQSKLYPGYVFIKMVMNDNTWYIVRNTARRRSPSSTRSRTFSKGSASISKIRRAS